MPEEFESWVLTLKKHQVFSVYRAPEELKSALITGHSGFCSRLFRSEKSYDYRNTIGFVKLHFENFFPWTGLKNGCGVKQEVGRFN